MPAKRAPSAVGRPKGRSGLPVLKPGEPLSLLGMLRECNRMLTVEDVAGILGCSKKTVYGLINKGQIPVPDLGLDLLRVDPKAWAYQLERKNPHLVPSAREYQAA